MSISPLLSAVALTISCTTAQGLPLARPPLDPPPVGDPRLEPIPSIPQHYGTVTAYGGGRQMHLRFAPRVNGQNHSDGDRHADLYVLFDASSGLPVDGQLPIVEAVPRGAATIVTDLEARKFSASWQVHVVTVTDGYDPSNRRQRIDSVHDIEQSSDVRRVYETNIHINAPVVPLGSSVEAGAPAIKFAWFKGQVVALMPCSVDDGGFSPQVMFRFVDNNGTSLPNAMEPHLVLSRTPSDSFSAPIWDVWTVTLPIDIPATLLRSIQAVHVAGFPIRSAHVRLNAHVTAVETSEGSDVFVATAVEDGFAILRNDYSQGIGRFDPRGFPISVPEGMSVQFDHDGHGQPIGRRFEPAQLMKQRTFAITQISSAKDPRKPLQGLALLNGNPSGRATDFPRIADDNGSFVPLILNRPFAITDPSNYPPVSNPVSSGEIIRIHQQELDAGYLHNTPHLPAAIEQNIEDFIEAGLMDAKWAIGRTPYHERLALVGRALHELVWTPEQGAQAIDSTSCVACHTLPVAGGAARGSMTSHTHGGTMASTLLDAANAGSIWGAGASQLLVDQKWQRGETVVGAHGTAGASNSIRGFVSFASASHLGILSTEIIARFAGISLAHAATLDIDNDNVVNEMTVGEVTAHTAFLLSLPVPREATHKSVLNAISVSAGTVLRGRLTFNRPIATGGPGCADCHTPFHPMASTMLPVTNPETDSVLHIPVDHHLATSQDVRSGLAEFSGQPGLRNWGDFKLHKMGALIRGPGSETSDVRKTAELWDVGSVYPLLRDGSAGADLRAAITAHLGVVGTEVLIQRGTQVRLGPQLYEETVTLANQSAEPIAASAARPIRLVLTGPLLPVASTAANVDQSGPHGAGREGSVWLIESPIQPNESVSMNLRFLSPVPVSFDLVVQDHDDYSEAVASTRAFLALPTSAQDNIIGFLRAQTIDGRLGENGTSIRPLPERTPCLSGRARGR